MSITVVENREAILREVEKIIRRPITRNEKLFALCELLDDEVEVFDWTGFYLVDTGSEQELVLGPYVGNSTEHMRIPFGKGICGQAAEKRKTVVVQDVSEEENYLACSMDVKAEIVVPIINAGRLVGVLDIDSHTGGSITEEHREMLEEIGDIVADLF